MSVVFFLLGVAFALVVEFLLIVYIWSVKSVDQHNKRAVRPYEPTRLPECLLKVVSEKMEDPETCIWFNLALSFLFDEWRDSIEAKQVVMKKIQKELTELLAKAVGKVAKDLTVSDYTLGTSLPEVNSVKILNKALTPNNQVKELDLLLDIEYGGGFELAIDANLLFNKSAVVVIRVNNVRGRVVLKFTKDPFTHWSFSFLPEPAPLIDLTVTAEVERRNISYLAGFIEMSIHRTIRKKHTLPNRKARFKPFLPKKDPLNPVPTVSYGGNSISAGTLNINLIQLEKLPYVPLLDNAYCTLSIDSAIDKHAHSSSITRWLRKDVKFEFPEKPYDESCDLERILNLKLQEIYLTFKEDRLRMISVSSVAQENSYIQVGFILESINTFKISTVQDANKILERILSGEPKLIVFHFLKPPSNVSPEPIPKNVGLVADQEDGKGESTRDSDPVCFMVNGKKYFQTIFQHIERSFWWKGPFSFVIKPEDTCLDLHIWAQRKGTRKDILMGSVSMRLNDLSLTCVLTSSGLHHQRYILTSSDALHNMITDTRSQKGHSEVIGQFPANIRLPSELKDLSFFPGEVLMAFHFIPSNPKQRKEAQRTTSQEKTFSIPRAAELPSSSKHSFQQFQSAKDAPRYCSICHKKIKNNKVFQCEKCGMLCDKKCMSYSMKQVKCVGRNVPTLPDLKRVETDNQLDNESGEETATEKSKLENILTKLEKDFGETDKEDIQTRNYYIQEIENFRKELN